MRKLYYDLLIDKKPIPTPDADVIFDYTDVYSKDSSQDESGVKHNFVLRKDVLSLTFSYSFLSRDEYRYIRSLFAGKSEVTVTYRDESGSMRSFVAAKPNHRAMLTNAAAGYYGLLKITLSEL